MLSLNFIDYYKNGSSLLGGFISHGFSNAKFQAALPLTHTAAKPTLDSIDSTILNHHISHRSTQTDAIQLFTEFLKTRAVANLKLQQRLQRPSSSAELDVLAKESGLQLGAQAKVALKKITLMFEATFDGNCVDMNLVDLDLEEASRYEIW